MNRFYLKKTPVSKNAPKWKCSSNFKKKKKNHKAQDPLKSKGKGKQKPMTGMRLSNNSVIGINSHRIESSFVHVKRLVYKNINGGITKLIKQIKNNPTKMLK